jgi:3-oxoacyl-[acyl-carrier-protein] synthase III
MREVGIRRLSLHLGDQRVWYRDLRGIEEEIRAAEIPDEEDLWNWGFCHRASGSYHSHVARSLADMTRYLAEADVTVDAVIGCGPFQTTTERFVTALASEGLLEMLGGEEKLRLVEDRECVNVIQAIDEARQSIGAGSEHVLIVAAEKIEEDFERFRPWCFFSDFGLALLLSSRTAGCPFTIRDVAICADPEPGEDGDTILARDLERGCVAGLLAANRLVLDDVDRFFYMNIFEPIAQMKGAEIGFHPSQLYTALSREMGHCFGADPFINLQSYCAGGGAGETYVLCASGRKYTGASIVQRERDQAC